MLDEMLLFDPESRDFYTRIIDAADDEVMLVRSEQREARKQSK